MLLILGYQEKAFAMAQALVEFNCFCPHALAHDEEAGMTYAAVYCRMLPYAAVC